MPGAYTPWEDVSLPDSQIRRSMRINRHGRHAIEHHVTQECEEILEINKALLNEDNFSGSLWHGQSWIRVAQIPLAMLEKWMIEEDINFLRWNDDDKARIMRRLNDPSFRKLRTAPGRI
jgi:hypothetical protein